MLGALNNTFEKMSMKAKGKYVDRDRETRRLLESIQGEFFATDAYASNDVVLCAAPCLVAHTVYQPVLMLFMCERFVSRDL